MTPENSIHDSGQSGQSTGQEPPPKPTALLVIPEPIPDELKAIDQWVVWRYAWQKGKWDKPPLQSRSGNLASTTKPKTWSTFDAAMAAYETGTVDGIGFVFAKKNRLVGIDLDHCRDLETSLIEPWALEIIHSFRTYTELSPSGTGIHIIAGGVLPGPGVKTARVEMYDTGRYFTMTGHQPEVPAWT
jgi:putative DNA primase/helicase